MSALRGNLLFSSALVAGTLAFATVSAFADDVPGGIETVTVTATKRAENVQNVAISMEVFQAKQLEAFNTSDLNALQNYVPNMLIQQSPGNDAIFIRGFGSQAANYGFDQSVSLYQDGVYAGRGRQFMEPFFDVSQVEVLRGPQGALLGKNTAAGAVNITTAGPTDDFEGSVTDTYDFDRPGIDAYGYVSGPLSDTLSARLAVKIEDIDGYIKNIATGNNDPRENNDMGRLSLKYVPTANFDITEKIEYGSFITDGTNAVGASATVYQPLTDTKDSAEKFGIPERDDETSFNSATKANYRFDGLTLTSITGYSEFDDTKGFYGSVSPVTEEYANIYAEKFEQFSQELQLFSALGQRFEWIVGAYYDNSNDKLYVLQDYNVFGFLAGQDHQNFSQNASTWSAFGQGTFHVTDDLRVLGSLRYTDDSKDANYLAALNSGLPLFATSNVPTQSLKEGGLDPSATIQYDVVNDVMLYATYGQGSKAGGFVSNTPGVTASEFSYGAEKSTNYEIGTKMTLWSDRLIFDIDLYDLQFKNLQVSTWDPTIVGFVTSNAAAATSKGVETSLDWMMLDNLRLSSSAAYLDAIYNNFPGAACLASQPVTCVAATNNLAGTTIPGASRWTGNVQADYWHPIGDGFKIDTLAAVIFRSTFTTSDDESPIYGIQKSYAKLNARVEFAPDDDRWSIALVGKNLTNRLTESFSYLWPLSATPQAIKFLDETRTISLEVHYRF
jgi:iron complex outermembrane recepter protein